VIKKFVLPRVARANRFPSAQSSSTVRWVRRRTRPLMPLRESEAIVLQSYPLGEADRLVSFLSRTMGRMRGVAAGARRPKSRFGSTLQRLSYVRIWFFERETRDLVRISQCELIESFLEAFRDYARSVALSLVSEITEAVLPEREASDPNFRLVLLTAQTIQRTGKTELPLAYFTLWTVKLGGWLPPLDRCGKCGRALAISDRAKSEEGELAYFSHTTGATTCSKCRVPGMRALSRTTLNVARKMLGGHLERLAADAIPPRTARELTDAMLDVIEHQIARNLHSRELLESPVG
jgi:DNA repair protein RecO (recombination protein O)